jgi:dTDP-4-amino-4,6-dideoxygalactose transaminase
MINVTKTFLPPLEDYVSYLAGIWERVHLTNQGPLVTQLEQELKGYLGVKHFIFCNNGTIALQIALKALNITGEVITTPFSYVATTSSILWENCTPVFVDIRPDDLNIDAVKIEAAITPNTKAIMAVHVYGNPCEVEKIERIAQKHNLKVIYDGAHAFGAMYKDSSVLKFGDVTTCSFHATKLFHTVEGGAMITNDDELAKKLILYRQFGQKGDDFLTLGINGKNSELHAAMGLCNLPKVPEIIARRKEITEKYDLLLSETVLKRPTGLASTTYNYAYYPVIFPNEASLLNIKTKLAEQQINTRRYFYPSLNNLPYLPFVGQACPMSEDVSSRVLSLPLYYDISMEDIELICTIIKKNI